MNITFELNIKEQQMESLFQLTCAWENVSNHNFHVWSNKNLFGQKFLGKFSLYILKLAKILSLIFPLIYGLEASNFTKHTHVYLFF